MEYDPTTPSANKPQSDTSYPRPTCDPKKTITHITPAAEKPQMAPDPSLVYRGSRPNRPPASVPKGPSKSLYPQRGSSKQQKQKKKAPSRPYTSNTNTSCPFISQPPLYQSLPRHPSTVPAPTASRYPQHPQSQVASVCSPPARVPTNPYAFGVHRTTHTNQ